MLALDEMSIESGNQVDLSTNSRFGDVTISNTAGNLNACFLKQKVLFIS